MGLLKDVSGKPIQWLPLIHSREIERQKKKALDHLLYIWDKYRNRDGDPYLWGDEYKNEHQKFEYVLNERGTEILDVLQNPSNKIGKETGSWNPEYAIYMVESTPRVPYESLGGCTQVEDNMSSRRKSAESHLRSNESILTIGSFPCLGHKTKGTVYEKNANKIFPHYLIAYDSRFVAITESIVKRKGKFVDIHIPKFLDQFTEITRTDIVLDGTGFGMGLCCLQLTIQMPNVHRSLLLYDYLANITPIMMALTASTPIHGGFLTNLDCRWSIIEQSVDDRNSKSLISKSRYSSIATFLTRNPAYAESLSNFNDGIPQSMSIMTQFEPKIIKKECEVCSELSSCSENEFDWKNSHYPNEWSLPLELYERLVDGIKDPMLVSHFSYILSIDPIITHDAPDLSDRFCYENIQSTNWQSLRLKIPSAEDVSLGWRVEFRTMEIQPSDYENAAFTVFVYLLSRAFDAATTFLSNSRQYENYTDKNFTLVSKNDTIESFENFASKFLFQESIQQIDENMRRAQSIDAVNSQMFLFHGQKVSCDHIVNGSKGLLEIINQYLDSEDFLSQQDWCDEEKHRIQGYLGFVSKRASGMIPTVSSRIRTFVKSHKSYKNDSIISSEVCTDLIDYLCDWQPLGD